MTSYPAWHTSSIILLLEELEPSGASSGQTTAQDKIKTTIIWFFQELIRRGVYSRIDYKFLVVGHTYGAIDRSLV